MNPPLRLMAGDRSALRESAVEAPLGELDQRQVDDHHRHKEDEECGG